MPKTTAFELDMLELILQNTTLAAIGDGTGLVGSTVPGNVYIALCTGDPGEAGDMVNQEVTVAEYGQYTRQAVIRGAGWDTDGGNGLDNASEIAWTVMSTGTGATVTHFAICKATTVLTDDAIYYGTVTDNLVVGNGVTPKFAAGALDVTEE